MIDKATSKRYYHGGAPGLKIILPSNQTGAPTTADYGAHGVCRRDRVYITTSMHAALIFAAMHPSDRGVVYEVEPIGALEPDPDYVDADKSGEVSLQCESARVIAKHRVRHKDRMRIRKVMTE